MKALNHNMKKKISFIACAIGFVFVLFVLLYFFDVIFNTVIAEWFTKKFLKYDRVNVSLLNKTVMNHIFNWKLFKKYIIMIWFISMCMFAAVVYLLIKKYTRLAREKEREYILNIIERMTEEEPLDQISEIYHPIIHKICVLLKEQEIKNKEKDKISDMIAYLAHDLRTPLTSVIGYLNLFLDAPQMPDLVRTDYMKKALGKAKKLDSLIKDFFEITKYNSDKMNIHKQSINLHYMFVQLIDEFFPILELKKLKVDMDISEGFVVFVDPEKMARAFSNLLKNACSYSFSNTTILISAKKETEAVEIFFSNKGQPISEHQREHVFSHFVRLDEARSADSGGSGLGLAIAKAIINQHEGQITVYTENGMNVFKISLPQNTRKDHETEGYK